MAAEDRGQRPDSRGAIGRFRRRQARAADHCPAVGGIHRPPPQGVAWGRPAVQHGNSVAFGSLSSFGLPSAAGFPA